MKKNISIVILMLVISLTLCFKEVQYAQEPQGIIEKCISALGGETAIKKQLDFAAEGEFKIAVHRMEITGQVKWIFKAPKTWNKFKATFAGNEMTQTQAFDGKNAWMDRFGTLSEQSSLSYESDLAHTVNLLIDKNTLFSTSKETEIEGKKTIGIDANLKGKKTTFFIDQETFLPLEIVFEDYYISENAVRELSEKRIRCLEYKNISGVLFPTKTTIYIKGKKYLELNYTKVAFNQPVSDDIFARPDQELDLSYSEEMIN